MPMKPLGLTLGVEEEVFILEWGRLAPTLQSLDYLRKLFWNSPRRHAFHTASNFARGSEREECFMGSVEISTGMHGDVESLLQDLRERRAELARVAEGVIAAVGALFTLNSRFNTAGTHIHIGAPPDMRERLYRNLAYFAPVWGVASANSPWAGGKPYGLSYRMAEPGCLGPLREDPEYRFQDVILSKRLKTVELRLLDPIPEWERLEAVVRSVWEVAQWTGEAPFSREKYNYERQTWTRVGVTPYVQRLWEELGEIGPLDRRFLESPLSLRLDRVAQEKGVWCAYEEVDRLWREVTGVPSRRSAYSWWRAVAGVLGYYAIRVPYVVYKGYREWYG
jgi:hypothetical protein